MLPILFACAQSPDPGDSGESADAPVVVDESTDVLVIGTGPAGLTAAMTAIDAGARVILLEMGTEVGMGLRSSVRTYGAATRWQEEAGLVDSLEQAAIDWEAETGESASQPSVAAYLAASAGVLEFLAARGAVVTVKADATGNDVHGHWVTWSAGASALDWLTDGYELDYRLQTKVTEPLLQDGRVVGVVAETAEGERRFGADAVVVASGGFLRDLDLVAQYRPEVLSLDPIFETNPGSTGSCVPFLTKVGADWHKPEEMAIYLHSIRDPRLGEHEALLILVEDFVIVGRDGRRFAAEDDLGSFDLVPAMPDDGAFMIVAYDEAAPPWFEPPGYNWAVRGVHEAYSIEEVVAAGSDEVWPADSLPDALAAAGLPPDTVDEVEAYNDLCTTGAPDPLGATLRDDMALRGDRWLVVELRPGLAKNYGGVRTDTSTRVLDAQGQAIPGLYAAGEVAGMVPGGGAGQGFNGSVGAVWYGGRLAGERAASEALAR